MPEEGWEYRMAGLRSGHDEGENFRFARGGIGMVLRGVMSGRTKRGTCFSPNKTTAGSCPIPTVYSTEGPKAV